MARGIYKIINVINNKFYVGSAVNFAKRKTKHWSLLRNNKHPNKHLQAAWIKYGEQAFVFVVVKEVSESDDILAAENVWLKEHVGQSYCYNKAADATAPGIGTFGDKNPMWGKTFNHTESAKRNIGAASKGRVQSEETKAKRRATMQGHQVSSITRMKISAALTGEGNFWYGKNRPDHGAKVSKAVVVDDGKGNVQVYPSIQALRKDMGVTPTTVNRALKSGVPLLRGPYAGFLFKYVDKPNT